MDNKNIPLIKKYLPKSPSDIAGQETQLKELLSYIHTYKKQKKKAALLYGPTGTGKSSSVYTVASELNLEVVEINASDYRKPEQIEMRVGNALKQRSLFSKGKLILVDDVDGLSGTKDRGGLKAIMQLIESSPYPVILTALDAYTEKLKPLAKKCSAIEFKQLDYSSIFSILKNICDKERINYEEDALKSLSYISAGDARSAINDLESLSGKKITSESIKELSERNRKDTIITALNKVFKTTDLSTALNAFNNIDEDVDKQFLWLDENLPYEYKNPEDLAEAYDKLSKADVFNRRIRRWQHYRFLVYVNALISGGIAVSKDKKYNSNIEYKQSKRILKIWISNQKQAKKKSIASKIASKSYMSKNEIMKTLMPYVSFMAKDGKFRERFVKEFELDEKEVEWLGR